MDTILGGLRAALRLLIFKFIILTFLVWSYICHWFIRDQQRRLRVFSGNTRFFCGLILRGFNLQLNVVNQPSTQQNFLLVSNHMGFVDIFMLASRLPMLFVTSHEMRETPFLGTLTEMGGCVFVERRSRTKILEEMRSIVEVLRQGFSVTLYPEATSTNGERVLPFKKTLMMAAAEAGVPIQPVVVNFRKINGEDFTVKWRDHVCWYGDVPFVTAMWKTLTLRSIHAEVEFLEQVIVAPDEDRGLVAEKIHRMIATRFVPVRAFSEQPDLPFDAKEDAT